MTVVLLPQPRVFDWIDAEGIFAPLEPTPWLVPGLLLAPGRPVMIGGYGFSGKTLAVQSLALSIASGTPVWGKFDATQAAVWHLDYEQGRRATFRRYQRLAAGMGIQAQDLPLKVAPLPSWYLSSDKIETVLGRELDGGLCIIDSLRASIPGMEENDSGVRSVLDQLTRVSEATGTVFAVIHHSKKPVSRGQDQRTMLRGSSALFDASGTVFVLNSTGPAKPIEVQCVKTCADAEGGGIADFTLLIEDLPEASGIKPLRIRIEPPQGSKQGDGDYELEGQIAEYLLANPNASRSAVVEAVGVRRQEGFRVIKRMVDDGILIDASGQLSVLDGS